MPTIFAPVCFAVIAIIAMVGVGCTSEIDADGVDFACESDRDCADGFACLPGPKGQRYCQDPDGDQALDAGDGDVGDGEGDVAHDVEDDVGGQCEEGEEEACPCEDLPDDVQGLRVCSSDRQWGECQCPELCDSRGGEVVVEGAECGICSAGVYECDDGVAQCSEPGAVNDCGGCIDQPSATACGELALICHADESTSCTEVETMGLNVEGPADLEGADVFYALFEVNDVNAACGQGWEVAASNRPVVYRRAQVDGGDFDYTVELPVDASPSSVVRLIIEHQLELVGEDQPRSVATHFGCTGVLPNDESLEIESYLHPNLFHGGYTVTFKAQRSLDLDNNFHRFWTNLANSWTFPAIFTFLSSPANIFVGCEGSECPHGSEEGLVGRYDQARSASGVPTLSFWSDFYGDFQTFIDDLDDLNSLRLAYESLFDSHVEEVNADIPGFADLHASAFDGDQFAPLESMPPVGRIAFRASTQVVGQPAMEPTLVAKSMTSREPLAVDCSAVSGEDPLCFQRADFVDIDSPTTSLPTFEFGGRLDELEIRSMSIYPPGQEMLAYFFYDYLPTQLYPRVEAVPVGPDQVEYQRGGWDSLAEIFRSIAPCAQVVEALEDQGVDAATAQGFGPLCDELYGDPDGLNVLIRISELVPLIGYDSASILMAADQNCTPEFEADPYHGIRLRSVPGGSGIQHCVAPFVDMSVTGAGAFVDVYQDWPVGLQLGLP